MSLPPVIMRPADGRNPVLRSIQPEDIPTLYDQQNDQVAADLAAFPIRSRTAHEEHWLKVLANPDNITRAIVVDGEVVGNIGCWIGEGGREVGYWIGRPYWGRGYASQALADLLTEVSERPVFAHVAEHNAGSIRVLEKCGFIITGNHQDDGEPIVEVNLRLDS
jgi:RimJ/RimL family protein N-acetyltransferase